MWPDPDDWLPSHSIGRRVEILAAHPGVALLRSNAQKYIDADAALGGFLVPPGEEVMNREDLFWDILERRTFTGGVNAFVRSSFFLEVNPARTIYETPTASQNFQMLLPLASRFPVLETNEPLAYYRIRGDSRSHSANTPELLLRRQETILDVLQNTLRGLSRRDTALEERLELHYRAYVFLPLHFDAGQLRQGLNLITSVEPVAVRRFLMKVIMRLRCSRIGKKLAHRWSRRLRRTFMRLLSIRDTAQSLRPALEEASPQTNTKVEVRA